MSDWSLVLPVILTCKYYTALNAWGVDRCSHLARGVVYVSRSVVRLPLARAAARIEVLFVVKARGGPKNIVLNIGLDPPTDSMRPSPDYFVYLF